MVITKDFIKEVKAEGETKYRTELIEKLYMELFDEFSPAQLFADMKSGTLFYMSAADYSDIVVYYDENNDIIGYAHFGYGTVYTGWAEVLENINY